MTSCYQKSLQLARERGAQSVAFPLISAGVYGYPIPQAIRVAAQTIRAFLAENDMEVYLVLYDRASVEAGREMFGEVEGI